MYKKDLIVLIDKAKRIYEQQKGEELKEVYVAGSQAILAENDNPKGLLNNTLDLDIFIIPYDEEYDHRVAFVAGADSHFALSGITKNRLYIDVIDGENARFPKNWESRVVSETIKTSTGEIKINFLNKHDLLLAKAVAARDKDWEYIEKMFQYNLVSRKELNRIWENDTDHLFENNNEKRFVSMRLQNLDEKYPKKGIQNKNNKRNKSNKFKV